MSENNQTKSNARGGKRQGAGRKPGSATKKTREIADKAASEGLTPLEYLLQVMRGEGERRERMAAAIAAAPYMHPKLASIEHTGADGGAIQTDNTWRLVLAKPNADADAS